MIDPIKEFFRDQGQPRRCSPRQCIVALGPPPDGRSVPVGSRSCARKTSGPTASGEPAVRLAGSVGRRRKAAKAEGKYKGRKPTARSRAAEVNALKADG